MPVQTFDVVVPGPPRGQARPQPTVHGGNVRRKTPSQLEYEDDIILAWRKAGSPRLIDGPYLCVMMAHFRRPTTHYNRTGLTPEGVRAGKYPCVKPDADNLLKQVDVLVAAGAIPDDKAMVRATCFKLWSPTRSDARLHIRFTTLRSEFHDLLGAPPDPDTEGAAHGE